MAISVNRVILTGRLGSDPARKGSSPGFVTMSVATSRKWKSRDGEAKEDTQWHNVVVYNEHAANFADKYLRKGDLVYVEGCLETREYENRDGAKVRTTEVVVRPFDGQVQGMSKDGDRGGGRGSDRGRGAEDERDGGEREAFGSRKSPAAGRYVEDLDADIPF